MSVYSILSDELKAKLRNCRTEEELKNVLAQENIELDPQKGRRQPYLSAHSS